jgi:hypothetical protein
MKESEVGGACATHRGVEKRVQRFGGRAQKERDHVKYQAIDGSMGSKWTLERLVVGCVEWIHLAQDRDRWQAVVNAVMNLQVLAPQSYLVGWLVSYLVSKLVNSVFQQYIL